MKKGLYEIFTVLFFLIVLLIALFFWLQISGSVSLLKAASGEQRLETSLAKEAYDTVVQCNGQQVLEEAKVEECLVEYDGNLVRAIKLEQEPLDGCAEKSWGVAAFEEVMQDTGRTAYPYWVAVSQEDEGRVCLARMVIAV